MTEKKKQQAAITTEECDSGYDTLTATMFRRVLTGELPGCDNVLVALWMLFSMECIEDCIYIHGCSSGDFGVDLNRWLGYLCAALLRVKRDFGLETAREILHLPLDSVLLYPWEILGAAEYYRDQGSMEGISGAADCGGLDDNAREYRPLAELVNLKQYEKAGAA